MPYVVVYCKECTDLAPLHNLQHITSKDEKHGYSLSIYDSDKIRDLTPLSQLRGVLKGDLMISHNAELTTLDGLNRVSEVGEGELYIANNDKLESIDALNGITDSVWKLYMLHNPKLRDLSALSGITNYGHVYVKRTASMKNIECNDHDCLKNSGIMKADGAHSEL